MLVLRKRWSALVSVVPAALMWLWWFGTYSSDNAAQTHPGTLPPPPALLFAGLWWRCGLTAKIWPKIGTTPIPVR